MKEDLGLKMLEELGLITIDNNLMKCTPKYSNIYRKTSDAKEGETPETYCFRISQEMFSDIIQLWLNTQNKQRKEDVYTLFYTILSINIGGMERYLKGKQ
jgi:hypothetical protein